VEHVHVNEGAQAVIGNLHPQESGRAQVREAQMRPTGEIQGENRAVGGAMGMNANGVQG
jgi:hypothetical protein